MFQRKKEKQKQKSNLGVFPQRCASHQSFFKLQGCQRREKSSPNDLSNLPYFTFRSFRWKWFEKMFRKNGREQNRKTAPIFWLTEKMQPNLIFFRKAKTQSGSKVKMPSKWKIRNRFKFCDSKVWLYLFVLNKTIEKLRDFVKSENISNWNKNQNHDLNRFFKMVIVSRVRKELFFNFWSLHFLTNVCKKMDWFWLKIHWKFDLNYLSKQISLRFLIGATP